MCPAPIPEQGVTLQCGEEARERAHGERPPSYAKGDRGQLSGKYPHLQPRGPTPSLDPPWCQRQAQVAKGPHRAPKAAAPGSGGLWPREDQAAVSRMVDPVLVGLRRPIVGRLTHACQHPGYPACPISKEGRQHTTRQTRVPAHPTSCICHSSRLDISPTRASLDHVLPSTVDSAAQGLAWAK